MRNVTEIFISEVKNALRDKKTKEQLLQLEKLIAIGKLVFVIAHQLKNPLNNLSLSVYSLKSLISNKNPKVIELFKDIESEIDRSSKIIQNFLVFAQPSKLPVRNEDINLILEQTVNLIKDSALFKDIRINKKFNSYLPKIPINPDSIKEVFLNIILNAQEAMSKGGELTITTDITNKKDSVMIIFTDTGCGISKEKIKDIFDPFYTTKKQGMGLGLYIAQRVIQEHGGSIKVESKIGEKTTFSIKLPINGRKGI